MRIEYSFEEGPPPVEQPMTPEQWEFIDACAQSGKPVPKGQAFWKIWHAHKKQIRARNYRVTMTQFQDGRREYTCHKDGPDGEAEAIAPGGLTPEQWQEAAVQQHCWDALATTHDFFQPPLPKDRTLRAYQHQGVAAMIRRLVPIPESVGIPNTPTQGGVYLGDEMGLGKTVQTVALMNWLTEATDDAWPILILCPKSIRFVWRMEWIRWTTTRKFCSVAMTGQRNEGPATNARIFVCNYDKLSTDNATRRALLKREWGTLICDESQALKNAAAGRTQAAKELRANYKIFLSGTPMPNRPVELKSQLDMITQEPEGYWGTTAAFERRYDPDDYDRLEELRARLRASVFIRRLKTDHDIASELPDKERQLILCEPTDEARKAQAEAEASLRKRGWQMKDVTNALQAAESLAEKESNDAILRQQVADLQNPMVFGEVLATLRRKLAEAKVNAALSIIEDFLSATGEKLVVFAHHRGVIERIHDGLAPYRPVLLYGGLNDYEREHAVTSFQEDEDVRVFVGGLHSASEGLTLTAARNVLFVEQDWTPARMLQAEDRVHRIGQTQSVGVRWLVVDETIDVKVAQIILKKLDTIRATLRVSEY